MNSSPTLSVVIAAGNEETMLGPCLDLLGFADEIVVVVDATSTDRTEAIARQFTSRVYHRQLESFAQQKNFGISKARSEWVLVVDADERITPALAGEIIRTLRDSGKYVAFRISRLNFFFGRPMRHGGWQHDRPVRLIRRSEAVYTGDIHEEFKLEKSAAGQISEPIWHFSHRNIQSMLAKTIRFGDVQSNEMLRNGHSKVTTKSFFTVPAKELYQRLVRHRGYKDGIEGVIESIYQAFSLCFVYAMLWQRQRKPLEKKYAKLESEAGKQK